MNLRIVEERFCAGRRKSARSSAVSRRPRDGKLLLLRALSCSILAVAVALASLLGWTAFPAYALPTGFQEYYVLGNETQVLEMFRVIQNAPNLAGSMASVVTIVATADRQVVYYDHWEDGYEPDIYNPIQASTERYGVQDPLQAGDIIALNSDGSDTDIHDFVPVPRGADLHYDGGDRLLSIGGPIDVVHALWPEEDIFVGGAWEIYPVGAWATGYSYIVPVGEDTYDGPDGYFPDFEFVWLEIQALDDNTTVHIDNGNEAVSVRLDRGQTYSSMGHLDSSANAPRIDIHAGTTLLANKPIQGGLVTGRQTNQTRFYTLVPDADWGTEYVAPIPRTNERAAEVYLYNPDDVDCAVTAYDADTPLEGASFTLSARTPLAYRHPSAVGRYVPPFSALRLHSSGPLWAVASADTGDFGYDWGFSFVSTRFAGHEYYVSWAPGTDGTSNPPPNASPVWVAPLSDNTSFSVDYSQPTVDGVPDQYFLLDSLQIRRVYDPDGDNTGMHIQADKPFVAVWGEDPFVANNLTGLDMGYPVLPLDEAWQDRVLTLHKTPEVQTLPPNGGIVTFTLRVETGAYPLTGVDITDTLPLPWSYVSGSTRVTYPDGSTDDPEPAIVGQTLSWPLATPLAANQSLTLTFQAQLTDPGTLGEICYDDLESGSYEGGGGWSEPWMEDETGCSGNCVDNTADTTYGPPHSGSRHLTISESGAISRAADLSAFQRPFLRFWRRLNDLGSADSFDFRLYDGTGWITLQTFDTGSEPGIYIAEQLDLTPYRSSDFALQFRADAGNATGILYLDDVEILDTAATYENAAQATGTYLDHRFSSQDEALVILSPLSLYQSVDKAQSVAGERLTYTLTYANGSQTLTATNVLIRDILPANTTFLSASSGYTYLPAAHTVVWGLSPTMTLPAGASGTLTVTVVVDQWTQNGQILRSQSYIDSDQTLEAASNPVETVVQAPEMGLAKTGLDSTAPGQAITYTIAYTNTGPVTATGVIIRDSIPAFTTYQVASMAIDTGGGYVALTDAEDDDAGHFTGNAISVRPGRIGGQVSPGEWGRIRFAVRVGPTVPVGEDIANYATLTRDYARPQNSALLLTAITDLALEKRADRDVVGPGQTIAYTITVGSSGSLTPTQVYVADSIPAHTDYLAGTAITSGFVLSYSTDQGETWISTPPVDPGQVTDLRWYTPTISSDTDFTLGYQVEVEDPLGASNVIICNQANAWSTQTSRFGSNEVCIQTVDLALGKTYDGPTVIPGQPITYTLSYANNGSATALSTVLTDTVPDHTTFDAGASASGWSCSAGAPPGTRCTLALGDLPPGGSGALAFVVVVTSPLPAGVDAITNAVHMASERGFSVTDTIAMPVLANAELVIAKTDGITIFEPGDVLTYTVTLFNAGNQAASGIVLTDTLPDYTTLVPGSASGGGIYTPATRQVVWTLTSPLAGGATITRTFGVTVEEPLPDDITQITNTITVADDGANGDTLMGNLAVDVDALDYCPVLKIIKHGPTRAKVGDTVVFTFTLATVSYTPTSMRSGAIGDGSSIRDVLVSDSIADPIYVRGDDGDHLLELGEAWVYTAAYTVQDTDPSSLVNVGTATGRDGNGEPVSAACSHTTAIIRETLYLPVVLRDY